MLKTLYDRFKILDTILAGGDSNNLQAMVGSEARIILLYSTREEARSILKAAQQMGLTGEKYVWIATQSVIGSTREAPAEFPVGMLGNAHYSIYIWSSNDNKLQNSFV